MTGRRATCGISECVVDTVQARSSVTSAGTVDSGTCCSFPLATDASSGDRCCRPDGCRGGPSAGQAPGGAPLKNRGRAREAGLAEVAGAVIAVAVAVGAGSAFYLAVLDSAETYAGANDVVIAGLRLVAPAPGDAVSSVYAEATISVLYAAEVRLDGDISDTVLFDGLGIPQNGSRAGLAVSPSGNGVIIHYSGMLNLTEPKSPGDAVSVIVRYGDQSRSVAAVVEGA